MKKKNQEADFTITLLVSAAHESERVTERVKQVCFPPITKL